MSLTFVRGKSGARPKFHQKFDEVSERIRPYLLQYLGKRNADQVWLAGQKIFDIEERLMYYSKAVLGVEQRLGREDKYTQTLQQLSIFKYPPVSVREFLCSPRYLNKEKEIYPSVLDACEELNSGKYVEAVLSGGIGAGKTSLALYTTAYQLYLLSCMRSPHRVYKLDPSSEILIIFQSITKQLAEGVDYQRFRDMIKGSPYFRSNFPFDKNITSKLIFPNRVEVHPVSGSETAAIGQNVIGGCIDEINQMAIVERSKSSIDQGTYDQAIAVYNSIARRRKSRFMEDGKMPGILCLVSSKRYPGQFTDSKVAEADSDPTIYVYDKRVWDVKPESFGQHGWFNVFSGDITRKPRVLGKDEVVLDADRLNIVAVPEEFRVEFEKDVVNALRDLAGVSTLSRHPFFLEVDKVNAAFKSSQVSIFSQSPIDFVDRKVGLLKSAFYKPELPRFGHIDLALTGDSAGLAIGAVIDFMDINATSSKSMPIYMPVIRMDGTLEIRPPRNSEILFSKIRQVIFTLKQMGLNIRWVTTDQYQGVDTQQILRQHGIITGYQSVDMVPSVTGAKKRVRGQPYDYCKAAIYDGRLLIPTHPKLQKEILMLEKDVKTGKIDHPPLGCFVGSTPIDTTSGPISFLQLIADWQKGIVYSGPTWDGQKEALGELLNPRITKEVTELIEVEMENGSIFQCTPEHLYLMEDGSYKEARCLVVGDTLKA